MASMCLRILSFLILFSLPSAVLAQPRSLQVTADGTYGIAIDAADNVYIGSDGPEAFDERDDEIVRFDADGRRLGVFGEADFARSGFRAGTPLAFDAAGNLYTQGNLYGPDGPMIVRYAPDGSFLGTFAEADIGTSQSIVHALAFTPAGHLLVRDGGSILEFDDAGLFLGTFATLSEDGGLAVDADGNVFASQRYYRLHEVGPEVAILKFDASGQLVATASDPRFVAPSNLLLISPGNGSSRSGLGAR